MKRLACREMMREELGRSQIAAGLMRPDVIVDVFPVPLCRAVRQEIQLSGIGFKTPSHPSQMYLTLFSTQDRMKWLTRCSTNYNVAVSLCSRRSAPALS